MSQQARQYLVNHPHTIFQRDSQKSDLLDETKTKTELIALLTELIAKGHIILFTAVVTDHHPDACLGLHSHENGFCADTWPLNSTAPTDYVNADDPEMDSYLADGARSPWLYQIGLAGSADTSGDSAAAGDTKFSDGGADHIHLGADS
jgi:hypothetical protein